MAKVWILHTRTDTLALKAERYSKTRQAMTYKFVFSSPFDRDEHAFFTSYVTSALYKLDKRLRATMVSPDDCSVIITVWWKSNVRPLLYPHMNLYNIDAFENNRPSVKWFTYQHGMTIEDYYDVPCVWWFKRRAVKR